MFGVLFSLLIFNLPVANACENAGDPTESRSFPQIEHAYAAVFAIFAPGITDLTPEELLASASSFMKPYAPDDADGFEFAAAQAYLTPLETVAKNEANSAKLRSRAYLNLSGIQGLISRKYAHEGSMFKIGKYMSAGTYGKAAIDSLEKSLEFNPLNTDAAEAYGKAAATVVSKNAFTIGLIKRFGGIDVDARALHAVKAMKANHLTQSTDYRTVTAYLDKEKIKY
jgi:hypothetical protein